MSDTNDAVTYEDSPSIAAAVEHAKQAAEVEQPPFVRPPDADMTTLIDAEPRVGTQPEAPPAPGTDPA